MRAVATDLAPRSMIFSWLYLTQKKYLTVDRDHAYAIFRLAELTRCMPGAIAQVGPTQPALLRLLAAAVGDGRQIFQVEDHASTRPTMATPTLSSTLPGLPERNPKQSGIRHLRGGLKEAGRELSGNQRFCFVHLLDADPADLQPSLSFFLERLTDYGMLLLEVPGEVSAEAFSVAVRSHLQGRREKVIPLQTRHCLVIHAPTPAAPRMRPQVRIRQQQPLAAAL